MIVVVAAHRQRSLCRPLLFHFAVSLEHFSLITCRCRWSFSVVARFVFSFTVVAVFFCRNFVIQYDSVAVLSGEFLHIAGEREHRV